MSTRTTQSDIFVSYARCDRDRVTPLVAALEAAGWSISWDVRLQHGHPFRDGLAEQIRSSHIVLVVWTESSIKRPFVRSEASLAQQLNSYLPVKFDDVIVPLGLDEEHCADLIEWSRQPSESLPQDLRDSLTARIRASRFEAPPEPTLAQLPQATGAHPGTPVGGKGTGDRPWSTKWLLLAALIVLASAIYGIRSMGSGGGEPPSPRAQARDLSGASWNFREAVVPIVPCKLRGDASASEPKGLPARATVWLPDVLIGKVALYVTHSPYSGLLAPLGQHCGGWSLGNSRGLAVSPSIEIRDDPLARPKSLVMRATEDSGSFRNNNLGKLSAGLFVGTEAGDRSNCAPAKIQSRTFSDGIQVQYYCERLVAFEAPVGSKVADMLGPDEPTKLKVLGSASSFTEDDLHVAQVHLVRLDFAELGTSEALVAYYLSQSNLCEASTFRPCTWRPTAAATRDCPECPEMVPIPLGLFEMGATDEEEERQGVPKDSRGKASPQRKVRIEHSFSLGKYEVTKGQYAAFAVATGRLKGPDCHVGGGEPKNGASWEWPGFAQAESDPVVCVSWEDAAAYTEWLSTITGKAYRLPSEAEWEYAARAYKDEFVYWGQDRRRACRYGNLADEAGADVLDWPRSAENIFPCVDGYAFTTDVGTFRPNSFGLHDMLGNVFEWVQDCWHDNHKGADSSQAARPGGDCARAPVRGGAWNTPPWGVGSATRIAVASGGRYPLVGFRVARTD